MIGDPTLIWTGVGRMLVVSLFRKLFSMIIWTRSQCKLAAVNDLEELAANASSSILENVNQFSKPKSSFGKGVGAVSSYPQAAMTSVLAFAVMGFDLITAAAASQASKIISKSESIFSSLVWILHQLMYGRDCHTFGTR